ncbi:MAG TPA: DUF5667 domain-containing protein [Nocardioides sp.]|nr:DUF5667 domain-containing protein [Nocardioides sp.]
MNGGFASRRRADEFDALLSSTDGTGPVADPRMRELLEVVGALRAVPEATPRPEFVADLRTRLVAAAEAQPARVVDAATVARLTPTQRRGRGERRLAAVLGGFAVVAATGSMAMASQSALPGDVLYPVKRALENAQTNLQSDDAGKAQSLLDHAAERLQEVQALNARGDGDAAEIAATLQDFTDQTNQATSRALADYDESGDQDSLQEVRDFAGPSMDQLSALGDDVPDGARPALITAAQTVQQADSVAQQACPTCEGEPITQLPDFASLTLPDILLGRSEQVSNPDATTALELPRHHRKHAQPVDEPTQTATQEPTADPTDVLPGVPTDTSVPDVSDGPIEKTIKGLLGGGKGGSDGGTTDSTDGSVDNLVDGVTGLVGGLLN